LRSTASAPRLVSLDMATTPPIVTATSYRRMGAQVPSNEEKARRKVLREGRLRAESEAKAATLPPPAATSNLGRLATIDFYLWVAFGNPGEPDLRRAADLAAENVHQALQADLAKLGPVEVMTEIETADRACAYRLFGPDDDHVDVEVSTVLPYAVVLVPDGPGIARYLTEVTDDWLGQVVDLVRQHGLLPLSRETCRASSPVIDPYSGKPMTYFEALFRDESGIP
jgi:hypothetical protein